MTRLPDAHVEVPRYLLERERARRGDTLIQVGAVVLAAALLAGAAALQRPINTQREELQLVTSDARQIPWQYSVITAIGGPLRALAIDALWMRAEAHKDEGKYFEQKQLAEWVCTLMPRYARVWAHHAWNMSYNISVATHTPEERWQWVYNGVRLLRDRGIPNNPRDPLLYKELAWIIFHKIGDMLDDMHWYYKREWAAIFENILGPPPLTGSAQQVVDAFRPIAEAPATWAEFVARHPDIRPHAEALKAVDVDVEASPPAGSLRHPLETTFFDRYGELLAGTELELARFRREAVRLSDRDRRFVETFRAVPPALADALLAFLRAKVLREQYHMDPGYMLSLMTNLVPGKENLPVPFDWRMPEPHALYWARRGVEQGAKLKGVSSGDILNTDRNTVFALITLCKRGRMYFEINRQKPNRSTLDLVPDLRMVEPMHEMYLALGKIYAEPGEDVGQTAGEMLKSGHVNTLEEAVVLFYARGDIPAALKYLVYLRDNYKEPDGSTKQRYLLDLDGFVTATVKELADSYKEALALIHSFLRGAIFSLAEGDGNAYARQVERAQFIWNNYMKDKADQREGRQRLPLFNDMRADALRDFLVYGPSFYKRADVERNALMNAPSLLLRVAVWQAESDEIKRMVYNEPRLVEFLREQCEALGYDFAKAFPEPPGMEEFRKTHPPRTNPEDIRQPEEPTQ